MDYSVFKQNYKPAGEPKIKDRAVQIHVRRCVGIRGDEAQISVRISNLYKSGRAVEMLAGMELPPAEARRLALAICPDLLQAANNTVAYYASAMPGRKCLVDELNPCGGMKHWGGGAGCPLCSARAALAGG